MIKRILAPTDGSPESDRALPVIEKLAAAQDAEVLLVQVVDFPKLVDDYDIMSADVYQQMLDATSQAARENLVRLAAHFDAKSIRASWRRHAPLVPERNHQIGSREGRRGNQKQPNTKIPDHGLKKFNPWSLVRTTVVPARPSNRSRDRSGALRPARSTGT